MSEETTATTVTEPLEQQLCSAIEKTAAEILYETSAAFEDMLSITCDVRYKARYRYPRELHGLTEDHAITLQHIIEAAERVQAAARCYDRAKNELDRSMSITR